MTSSSFKLQVVFQSKAKDGIECGPETILLSNADIKQLKVKSGSYVTVELQHTSLLCRVWPSKKSSQGVATLNKLWTPNLSVDHRNVVVTNGSIASAIVVVCRKAVMTVYGEVGEEVAGAVGMADYVKNTLKDVLLVTGMLIGLTIRGHHFIIEVSELLGHEDQKFDGLEASLRFALDPSTSVFFRPSSSQQPTTKNNSAITSVASSTVEELSFAGYEEQRQLAAGLLKLGLGVIDPVRPVNTSLVAQQLFRPPKGLLLFGPPGTGKTSLMYSLVRNAGCACVEISHSILLGSFQGEAEQQLRAVFEEASRRAPCCILVDNMDLLCCQRSKTGVSDLQKRIVSCMLSLIDGLASGGDGLRPVFIIGTTTKPGDIDPAIRRSGRIDREIELGVPSASQRESIFRSLLQDASVVVTENGVRPENDRTFYTSSELVRDIARLAHGMVGADLLLVLKEAFFIATRRRFNAQQKPSTQSIADVAPAVGADSMSVNLAMEFESLTLEGEEDEEPVASSGVEEASTTCTAPESTTAAQPLVDFNLLTDQDFREALSRVSPSALREVVVEVPTVHWGDIGGMASVKQALREVVEWPVQQPGLFSSLGISPPKGVLLYGPPGCSKTLMAKALATESSMNFLAVRGPELLSKWLGESEKAIQTLFRRARAAAPAIVFFDEIDALAGKRGDSSAGVSDRVLAQLLTELDGVQGLKQVIVLAATNRPDMLDAALIRPGRIDRKIYVPPPDALSREQILRIELRKMPVQEPVNVAELVASTEGFSGAEMVAVCSEAAMLAVEEGALLLTEFHLREALRGITPQITEKMLEFYESFAAKV